MDTPPLPTHDHEYVLQLLRRRIGPDLAQTSGEILNGLRNYYFSAVNDTRQVRQLIHELRELGYPICSINGEGYYWPRDLHDVFETADVEFREDARGALRMARTLRKAGKETFGGQMRLI